MLEHLEGTAAYTVQPYAKEDGGLRGSEQGVEIGQRRQNNQSRKFEKRVTVQQIRGIEWPEAAIDLSHDGWAVDF